MMEGQKRNGGKHDRQRNPSNEFMRNSSNLTSEGGDEPKSLSKNGKSPKKVENFLQQDGQKVTNINLQRNYGDMSQASKRNETFKNFPKKILLGKILDSGYFYTGEEDKTICHSCQAVVFDWNEKDDPTTFHEPYCQYHRRDEVNKENTISSLEGPSLLDIPITESSAVSPPAVTLKPTLAPHLPWRFEEGSLHSIPTTSSRPLEHSGQQYLSLPAIANYRLPGTVAPPATKQFKQEKQKLAGVQIAEVLNKLHESLLKSLNLFSEEDRRKTFSINDCWLFNTNNVVNHHRLAKGGFFYLGNLDRTQCFSCNSVLRKWQRKDKISHVHKCVAPHCKMVLGQDKRNIPIPSFQTPMGSLSPPSSQQSSIECHLPNTSSVGPQTSSHLSDPNPTDIQLSSASLSSSSQKTTAPTPLSVPKEDQSRLSGYYHLQHQSNTPTSSVYSSNSSLEISNSLNQPQVTGSPIHGFQHQTPMPRFPISATQGQPMDISPEPLDLTTRQATPTSEGTRFPAVPLYQETNIQTRNSPNKINIGEHLPVQVSSETNEEQMGPPLSPTGTNVPPHSISSHIGQTTLYNNTVVSQTTPHNITSNTPHVPEPSSEAFPIPPSSSTSELAEIFPCNDPDAPHMRSSIARQETFDFSWAARGIGFTDDMARAGFYSTGGDQVRCWYCGGGAHHWDPEDDPWVEHARLYPNCEYLLQQRGPDFISEVSSRRQAARPVELPPEVRVRRSSSVSSNSSVESQYSSAEETSHGPMRVNFYGDPLRMFHNREPSPTPRVVDPREEEARHKRMIEAALNSELTLAAFEMGFDLKTIKKTTKKKIRDTDTPFQSPEQLLDALLQSAGNSDSSESEGEGQSGPTGGTNTSLEPGTSTTQPGSGETSNVTTHGGAQGEDRPKPSQTENAENRDPKQLDEKLREYEQEKRCKVCLDRDAEVVFVPCGHLCTCIQCANVLRTCPLCRRRIQKSMKIYTS